MASESRETRLKQKAAWELKLQQKAALLAEKGLDEKQVARAAGIKAIKAKIRAAGVRLRAIDANEQRTAELAGIKAERLTAPKEEAPKAKKPEPPADAKDKAKKKKKKEEGAAAPKA